MNCTQYVGLASSLLGVVGTGILFANSYSLQSLEGGVFGSPELTRYNDDVRRKNIKRLFWQKIGLICLCFSFIVQVAMILQWFCA